MANATIDALYAGSLRLKIFCFFLDNFAFYKWCVTKVAHCKSVFHHPSCVNFFFYQHLLNHWSRSKIFSHERSP